MNRCITGDCLDVLPTLEAASIDACVTDPPYGIGFMGREWDTFKPGQDRQAKRLIKDEPIVSDNPNLNGRRRSPAISPSQIDYDRGLEGQRGFQAWTERWAREVLRVLKPGAHMLVCGAPRSFHRMACGLEDAGFDLRDTIMWVFGSGFPKSRNLDGEWKGWGTALKPAWEPIAVARKPFIGTVAKNMERHGAGALNIDASRVGYISSNDKAAAAAEQRSRQTDRNFEGWGMNAQDLSAEAYMQGAAGIGRWPSNLIHDGSEEVVRLFPAEAGAFAPVRGTEPSKPTKNCYGEFARGGGAFHGDFGSAARFFYCAKASAEDRDEGCEALNDKLFGMSGAAAAAAAAGEHYDNGDGGVNQTKIRKNNHPTVKPIELMRYLCRLVTRPGGTILDPFMGSGSTGKACAYEKFNFIGIEREAEYHRIAEARIAFAARQECTAQIGLALA